PARRTPPPSRRIGRAPPVAATRRGRQESEWTYSPRRSSLWLQDRDPATSSRSRPFLTSASGGERSRGWAPESSYDVLPARDSNSRSRQIFPYDAVVGSPTRMP